ncbi:ankyrin repeat and LEM domain-containing protein 1 isoform X4 [Callithrix jacchus]
MCSPARLARGLREALREEESWAVEELLRRGADPNLVLEDGAAAVHLAAGARDPRGLRCLGILLCRGGDPNARSVEALTPLHVAAAWGCRRGLELLLSHGADPALRDQDGLRPLDLALQQGHVDCARVLRDLHTRTGTRTIGAETQEPDPAPGTPGLSGPPDETLDSIAQQMQPCRGPDFAGHSLELATALRTGRIPDAQADEDALAQQFERPDPARRWREGVVKSSFTYLLLDPRETQDLPARAFSLTPAERLQTFVRAIFYVGKGTRTRPYIHLWEALGHRGRTRKQACPKVRHILDIWASGCGVVSLHCFQHVVAVEAYTREACIVEALGIQTLTNQKQGHCYGVVAGWPPARRRRLGVHLLHRALLVFLAEGERQLCPQDIQARG